MMNWIVVTPKKATFMEQRTAQVFVEEIRLRTGISLETAHALPGEGSFFLFCEEASFAREFAAQLPAAAEKLAALPAPGSEGFRLVQAEGGLAGIGADGRGAFFAMGRALRKMELRPGSLTCPAGLDNVSMTPEYPLRGHQLAYRDKQNTCPAWDIGDFDRYIRDLALFGCNSIEILPPRTDDNLYSALFRRDPLEMMVRLSHCIHSYGMDVWLWYPNMGSDYDDPAVLAAEAAEREKVFSAIPYLDHILVPAGDPGDVAPEKLFPLTAGYAQLLRKYHPETKIWIAPQVFAPEPGWLETFYQEVDKEPEWLYGVCFAPWERDTIQELQERLPDIYKTRIRHYPDITHNTGCQFEVPMWDRAFALTLGREGNNTRPRAMKHIHNLHAPFTVGSLTYSEGIHDDVNKFVWSDQDFSTSTACEETVEDYVRLFISPDAAPELSRLILALEDNWKGHVETNENIDRVCQGFEKIAARYGESVTQKPRFQLAWLRALSDLQAKRRALRDAALEREAVQILEQAESLGADSAMEQAARALQPAFLPEEDEALRGKIQQLADSLFQTLHIQLTTWRHGGQRWIRGAYLDSIDLPLNNSQWYLEHFKRIRRLGSEAEKQAALQALLRRTDPGEGGIYANLGSLDGFAKHVVSDHTWEEDPGFLRSPLLHYDLYGIMMDYYGRKGWYNSYPILLEWVSRARVIYGTPLKAKFEGLDPAARYRLRVTYPQFATPRAPESMDVTLHAGDCLLHRQIKRNPGEVPSPVYEYELPQEAYQSGGLLLRWQVQGTLDAFGVSEVWILRE